MIASIFCYLLGCFPSGLLIAKLYGIDITKQGSGNVGATNIARNLGKLPGIFTLILDASKGIIAVLLLSKLGGDYLLNGIFVVLGHCFSIPKILKGGKGAATGIGVIFSYSFNFGVVASVSFLLAFLISKRVSVGTIAACVITSIFVFLSIHDLNTKLAVSIIAFIIVLRHKENIQRLSNGSEPKFNYCNTDSK